MTEKLDVVSPSINQMGYGKISINEKNTIPASNNLVIDTTRVCIPAQLTKSTSISFRLPEPNKIYASIDANGIVEFDYQLACEIANDPVTCDTIYAKLLIAIYEQGFAQGVNSCS